MQPMMLGRLHFPLLVWAVEGWLALAGSANAQSLGMTDLISSTPKCALPCVLDGFQAGGCTLANLSDCICTNITLQADLSACVQTSCEFKDQVLAVGLESQLCNAYPKESRRSEVLRTAIVCLAITITFVALRLLSRWKATGTLWWDDGLVVFSTVCFTILCGIEIASARMGFGMHYWDVNVGKGTTLLKLFYIVQILYIVIQVTAKVSIVVFFSRVFTTKWFKSTATAFNIFLVGHGLIFLFIIAFQCLPVFSIWDRSIVDRKCINVTAVGWAGAICSIVEDLAILVLPVPDSINLQLGRRKKAMLFLMFSVGSFACITSMVRLKYLVTFATSLDTTWDNVDIVIWSIIEECTALLCASLPALRPLLVHWLPRVFNSTRGNGYSLGSSKGGNVANGSHLSAKRRGSLSATGGNTAAGRFMELRDLTSPESCRGEKNPHDVKEEEDPYFNRGPGVVRWRDGLGNVDGKSVPSQELGPV